MHFTMRLGFPGSNMCVIYCRLCWQPWLISYCCQKQISVFIILDIKKASSYNNLRRILIRGTTQFDKKSTFSYTNIYAILITTMVAVNAYYYFGLPSKAHSAYVFIPSSTNKGSLKWNPIAYSSFSTVLLIYDFIINGLVLFVKRFFSSTIDYIPPLRKLWEFGKINYVKTQGEWIF